MQIFGDIEIENCEFETRRIFILDCEKISADLNCSIVELAVSHHHRRKGCRSMKLYFIDELSNYFNRIRLKHFSFRKDPSVKMLPSLPATRWMFRREQNNTVRTGAHSCVQNNSTLLWCARTKYTSFWKWKVDQRSVVSFMLVILYDE